MGMWQGPEAVEGGTNRGGAARVCEPGHATARGDIGVVSAAAWRRRGARCGKASCP